MAQAGPRAVRSLGRFSGGSLADVEAAQAELWKAWSPRVAAQRVAGADPHTSPDGRAAVHRIYGPVVWIFTELEVAEPPLALAEPPAPPCALVPLPAPLPVDLTDSPAAPSAVTEWPLTERPDWTITLWVDLVFMVIGWAFRVEGVGAADAADGVGTAASPPGRSTAPESRRSADRSAWR